MTINPKELVPYFNSLSQKYVPTMKGAMLVSPDGFAVAQESTRDNVYMNSDARVDRSRAKLQHTNLVTKLESFDLPVRVFPGLVDQPDGIYPNNVFATTTHRFIVGKMYHPVRQREANRTDMRLALGADREVVDLSTQSESAELTGAVAIDRSRNFGFCGLSNRATMRGSELMTTAFELKGMFDFELTDNEYHTNIVLAILAGKAAILYPGSFKDHRDAEAIATCYGEACIEIDESEKNAFVGNCIAVTPDDVLFSATATGSMTAQTLTLLEKLGLKIHDVEVDELEKGGGSLRCLIAEVF